MNNLREENWKSSFARFHNSKYGIFHRRKPSNKIWDHFRDWGSTPAAASAHVPDLSLGEFAPQKMQSQISGDGCRWVVTLDCRNFHPEDIVIRTIGAAVEIRAKTAQATQGDSNIIREFNRKYHLPEGLDPQLVESTLTYDGMLIISAPLPNAKRAPQPEENDTNQTVRLRPIVS